MSDIESTATKSKNYGEVAKEIIKDSIKSAIYIDENALEPYESKEEGKDESVEEERTINLYKELKKVGISLSVFKYKEKEYSKLKDYLFANRDLVLLDWQLEGDGDSGEKAIELLTDVIENQEHIHFCVVYSNGNKDDILKKVLSYFSGLTKSDCQDIRVRFDDFDKDEENNKKLLEIIQEISFYRYDNSKVDERLNKIKRNYEDIGDIYKYNKNLDDLTNLIGFGVAFDADRIVPSEAKPSSFLSYIDRDSYTLIIGNTIVTILNKKETKSNKIIKIFSSNIANRDVGVMQLLGLEIRNILRKKGAFVEPDVLEVTKKSLGYHKKTYEGDFESFLKNVMIEQYDLCLRNERLSIVESIKGLKYRKEFDKELISMNVFYNSKRIEGSKNLSFGDVFECRGKYYIGITPLCDCLHPKNDNTFYFAVGVYIDPPKAMLIGESGYFSYLKNNVAVRWDKESKANEKNKNNDDLSDADTNYITPVPFTVPKTNYENNIKVIKLTKRGDPKPIDLQYVTTIKQNYAQRIANHAFTHCTRVGIDFAKKK